ncbi:MAG: Do family serine endopeptidase [Deltaproteobacteria bacterium]|jgi:serine protease Do|nr:Do family serine endopeptidase [Deltaproteobacteria bacterium]
MSKRLSVFLLASLVLCLGLASPAPAQTDAAPPAAPRGEPLVALPSVSPVVKKASPAVVNIFTVRVVRSGGPFGLRPNRRDPRSFRNFDELLEEFYGFQGQPGPGREHKEKSLGSGFIFDPDGLVITNNHVVEGASDIKVKFQDGKEIQAAIVGRDPKTDLALLKLSEPGPYPFVNMGDSDLLEIGDWMVAIGNPFGLNHTVTAGILSAKGRSTGGPYDDYLQTDASINPGNSGGPLLNLYGEVVGINTVIYSSGTGGSIGIGFAIPSNSAAKIIDQLKNKGRVDRGWIGVVIQLVNPDVIASFNLPEGATGALVGDVQEGSPAQQGGIQHGDIIKTFDGKEVGAYTDLSSIVADTPIGKEVVVTVIRNGKETNFKLTVGRLEDDAADSGFGAGPGASGFDMGLTLREITPEIRARLSLGEVTGLLVEGVNSDSPAAEVGIQPQDVIQEVDRKSVTTIAEYNSVLRQHSADLPLLLWVRRGQQSLYFTLALK